MRLWETTHVLNKCREERILSQVTREEKIEKLRNLQKAYIIYSLYTRIPYVECEQANFYDQAFLFESREEAEEAAKRFIDNGDGVGITELKMVEMTPPEGMENVVPMRPMMRNQVREHLTKFPQLGINAVFFKCIVFISIDNT